VGGCMHVCICVCMCECMCVVGHTHVIYVRHICVLQCVAECVAVLSTIRTDRYMYVGEGSLVLPI